MIIPIHFNSLFRFTTSLYLLVFRPQNDINALQKELAKKPSFNDLNFYVKWADLEDALKGLRSELSNLQAQSLQNLKPVERVVIEQSMQTEEKN